MGRQPGSLLKVRPLKSDSRLRSALFSLLRLKKCWCRSRVSAQRVTLLRCGLLCATGQDGAGRRTYNGPTGGNRRRFNAALSLRAAIDATGQPAWREPPSHRRWSVSREGRTPNDLGREVFRRDYCSAG